MAATHHVIHAVTRAVDPAPAAPTVPAVAPDMLWGHSPEFWVAIGTAALAAATVALILLGLRQLTAIKWESRQWETLKACDRYTFDPILDVCLRKLRDAKNAAKFEGHEKEFRLEITTVLNCLEGIAVGIYQGVYIEDLARDHLQGVLTEHVIEYLKDGAPKKIDFESGAFPYVIALSDRWTEISRPRFVKREWRLPWRKSQ
jgi:hypothetical protein